MISVPYLIGDLRHYERGHVGPDWTVKSTHHRDRLQLTEALPFAFRRMSENLLRQGNQNSFLLAEGFIGVDVIPVTNSVHRRGAESEEFDGDDQVAEVRPGQRLTCIPPLKLPVATFLAHACDVLVPRPLSAGDVTADVDDVGDVIRPEQFLQNVFLTDRAWERNVLGLDQVERLDLLVGLREVANHQVGVAHRHQHVLDDPVVEDAVVFDLLLLAQGVQAGI